MFEIGFLQRKDDKMSEHIYDKSDLINRFENILGLTLEKIDNKNFFNRFSTISVFLSSQASKGLSMYLILSISIALHIANTPAAINISATISFGRLQAYIEGMSSKSLHSHRRIASELAWMHNTPKVVAATRLTSLLCLILRFLKNRKALVPTKKASNLLESATR